MAKKVYVGRRRPNRRRRRVILVVLVVAAVVIVGGLAALPAVVIGPMIHGHVTFRTVASPEEYGLRAEKVTLETADGLHIVAYDVYRPDPKAVVIFLSGIQSPSVTAFFGHARMLQENGYASVLLEMRAHGESEGDRVALGYEEWRDTQAVVAYIRSQPKYAGVPIVVFGLSMGGAVAIVSAGQIPEIDGVIALSAYSSFPDLFADQMIQMGAGRFVAAVERPFAALYLALKFGLGARGLTPAEQIANLGDRPALLIHSTEDTQVPFANFERLVARAPAHVETWVRPGDRHMIIDDYAEPRNDPEYAARILAFLERHFGS